MPETMKLLGSAKNKITKDKNREITDVIWDYRNSYRSSINLL